MSQKITQVDAFTDRAFAGNPAAVCLLAAPRDEGWMQNVAREMNLSETAFLVRRTPAEDGFDLRWFTPAVEVDLCGHATLASAQVLWEEGHLAAAETARFHTRSGVLTAERRDPWIELDFPSKAATEASSPELARALGAVPRYVGRNAFDYLVQVGTEAEVRDLAPDITRLREVVARGIIVTAPADDARVDFVSRFFAPRAGVDEDPVTGSAHCCLAPFWADRFDKTELLARQLSPRGGTVRVRVAGDRVILGGQAVTVLKGQLLT